MRTSDSSKTTKPTVQAGNPRGGLSSSIGAPEPCLIGSNAKAGRGTNAAAMTGTAGYSCVGLVPGTDF